MENKKKGHQLLGFAVLAECFILCDLLAAKIFAMVTDDLVQQYLFTWLVVYVVWGIGVWLVKKYSWPLRQHRAVKTPNWPVFVCAFGVSTVLNTLAWGGVKPYIELQGAVNGLGVGLGIGAYAMQMFYYALEAALLLLLIECGQQGGELLWGRRRIPYGGIAALVLWGLPHLYTQGLVDGLWVLVFALLYGIAVDAIRDQRKWLYPLFLLIFIF